MGSLSRRFLSLIVNEHTPGFKTLRCIDLTRQKLFYDAPAAAADGDGSAAAGARVDAATSPPASASETMGRLCLPSPSFTFRPGDSDASGEWGMHCFPLRDRNGICVDQSGLALAFDAETETPVVGIISEKEKDKALPGRAKRMPFSFSLPSSWSFRFEAAKWPLMQYTQSPLWKKNASDSDWSCNCDQAIFVMERFPLPEREEENSGQFEAFFRIYPSGYWMRRALRPPPFAVLKGGSSSSTDPGTVPEITAYTVIGRGRSSRVCVPDGEGSRGIWVSAAGAGTYCMNMQQVTNRRIPLAWKWTQVGEWMLPFHGKVEYVPELKLWFGFSGDSRCLAAADLSGMDSVSQNQEPPQLVGTWEELDPPKEWRECRDPQMVSLGSGKFCIARFFKTTSGSSSDDGETGEDFAVLTGVEMVPDDSGSGKLRMVRHMSRRLHDGGTIDTVF